GRIYVAGSFMGTADFDPGAGVTNRTSAGFEDFFLVQLVEPGPMIYNAPSGPGGHFVTLRRNGGMLELVDDDTSAILDSRPLASTTQVIVNGAANQADRLTIDFGFGGDFAIPNGIQFDGGTGGNNALRLVGGSQFNGEAYATTGPASGTIQLAAGLETVLAP